MNFQSICFVMCPLKSDEIFMSYAWLCHVCPIRIDRLFICLYIVCTLRPAAVSQRCSEALGCEIDHTKSVLSPSLNEDLLMGYHLLIISSIFLHCEFSNRCSCGCICLTLLQIDHTKSVLSPSLNAHLIILISCIRSNFFSSVSV